MPEKQSNLQKQNIQQDFIQKAASYANKYQVYSYETRSYHLRNQLALSWLDPNAQTILEAGCGPAILTADLYQRGYQPFALDLVEANLQAGQKRLSAHGLPSPLVVGDMGFLPFANYSFDAIVSLGVLEYILPMQHALQELHRVIHPGGVLVISLPNRQSFYRLWERYIYEPVSGLIKRVMGRSHPFYQRQEFSLSDAQKVVNSTGFRVTEIRPFAAQLIPQPLNRVSPRAALSLAEKLEPRLSHPQTGMYVGVEFLIRAVAQKA